MEDKNPEKITNDLPDVAKRAAQKESQNDKSATTDAPANRLEEAAVEKAIEKLPAD